MPLQISKIKIDLRHIKKRSKKDPLILDIHKRDSKLEQH